MIFRRDVASLESFLKVYKVKETKKICNEWFDCIDKLNNKEFPSYEFFFSILRNNNNKPLEKDYNNFKNLVKSGLFKKLALAKSRMDKVPPSGAESYNYLQTVWKIEHMQTSWDFPRWYNDEYNVLTLETKQKLTVFYNNKGIDVFKLGCTLTNSSNLCLHIHQIQNISRLPDWTKICWRNYQNLWSLYCLVHILPCIVVVDETYVRKSTNLFEFFCWN